MDEYMMDKTDERPIEKFLRLYKDIFEDEDERRILK